MRLIIGLGNPGTTYARTRHNAGVMVLERAAARWAIVLQPHGVGRWGCGRVGREEIILAGALAWMNETGPAVKALLQELALASKDLVVVHDDLDLEVGRLRIKRSGGAGGHNGILSLLTALGTHEFCRLKIGIGRPPPGEEPADYVLSPFTQEERPKIEAALDRAVSALECLLLEGIEVAMNRFNVRDVAERK